MTVLFAGDINPIVWREDLLKTNTNTQSDDSCERAMRDCRSDFDGNLNNGIRLRDAQGGRWFDVNILEIDNRELT
jgi:hypothetical protein